MRSKIISIYKYILLKNFLLYIKIRFNKKKADTLVVVCQWKRINRTPDILLQLDNQINNTHIVDVFMWNNKYLSSLYLIINIFKYKPKNLGSLWIYNSIINIGGFGRFYAARKLRNRYKYIIFLDDDELITSTFIENCIQSYQPKTISSFWAYKINGSYWNRVRASVGESADYCGTGGMIADSDIFRYDELFCCPNEFWFIEDLWISYFAKSLGWNLGVIDTKIEFVMPEQDQGKNLVQKKEEFYNFLKSYF